jgi:hypothetical protein
MRASSRFAEDKIDDDQSDVDVPERNPSRREIHTGRKRSAWFYVAPRSRKANSLKPFRTDRRRVSAGQIMQAFRLEWRNPPASIRFDPTWKLCSTSDPKSC